MKHFTSWNTSGWTSKHHSNNREVWDLTNFKWFKLRFPLMATRNPAFENQLRLVDSSTHYLQGFIYPRWLALGFLNHQLRITGILFQLFLLVEISQSSSWSTRTNVPVVSNSPQRWTKEFVVWFFNGAKRDFQGISGIFGNKKNQLPKINAYVCLKRKNPKKTNKAKKKRSPAAWLSQKFDKVQKEILNQKDVSKQSLIFDDTPLKTNMTLENPHVQRGIHLHSWWIFHLSC